MRKKFSFRFYKELPAHEKRITFSTVLTSIRILLVPFIIAAMVAQRWGLAFKLFIAAMVTDFFDGNTARWFNQKTFLGACLDPIADKLLLVSCFATLAFVQSPLFSIPRWFVLTVLVKELLLIGGALYILLTKEHLEVRPTWLGKITTVVQMLFIVWLFACYFFHWMPIKTYWTMLGLLLILVIMSLVQYVRIGLRQFFSL